MRRLVPLILLLLSACGASVPPAETSGLLAPTIMVINPVTAAPATAQPPTQAAAPAPVVATLPPATLPPANPDLAIRRQGWSQDDQGVTLAVVVENTSDQHSYERVPYQITLYAADRRPVGIVTGTLMLLLPGTTVGMVEYTLVPEPVVALDLVIADGPAVASTRPSRPIFESRLSRYVAQPAAQVTGVIVNNLVRDVQQVQVSAIAYAADDTIVGGGTHRLLRLAASSETAVTVPIRTTVAPVRVELWVTFTPESFGTAQP